MRPLIAIVVSVVGLIPVTRAQQEFVPRIEFDCAGTAVTIDVRRRGVTATNPGLISTVLSVVRDDPDFLASVRTWERIDFIGGTCISDADGNPAIVYQTFRGDSGDDDQGNWGIFDAVSLREVLTPSELNTAQAREALGVELPRLNPLISVSLAKEGLEAEQSEE